MGRTLPLPRVIIAGQIPPPAGGQAMMIERLLKDLARHQSEFTSAHLAFHFTRHAGQARRAGLGKIIELFAVLYRLARLRIAGPIDLLLYPSGGPQRVPLIRDLLLLPWMLLASRRMAIHFHAGGLADAWPQLPKWLQLIVRALYRKATAAIVMTEFGRHDPEFVGIQRVVVAPHTVEDHYDPRMAEHRQQESIQPVRLLYVGHLCPDKGTPELIEAVGALKRVGVDCRLDLIGEPLAPYTEQALQEKISQHGLEEIVETPGVLSGNAKWARFAEADLFVFPSVAPYESFGLVLVEAMMWALPVVATDWRGNAEVLGIKGSGGLRFSPTPDLATALRDALAEAFRKREMWLLWGEENRRTYEHQFKAQNFPDRMLQTIKSLI